MPFTKEQRREWVRKVRAERKRNHECTYCGEPLEDGERTACADCKARYWKNRPSNWEEQRKKREAASLCNYCGKRPRVESRKLCAECLEYLRKRGKENYAHNSTKVKESSNASRLKLRLEVFNAYGGAKCYCCGETTLLLLSMDHINNNGAEHRKELSGNSRTGGGAELYRWLRKNNFPAGYQVACFSCNWGKHANGGICPHKSG